MAGTPFCSTNDPLLIHLLFPLQKMGQSSVSSFFDRRGKKALVEALEVGPHSGPYLIVKFKSKGDVIKSQDFSHKFYIIFLELFKFLIGLRKDKKKMD